MKCQTCGTTLKRQQKVDTGEVKYWAKDCPKGCGGFVKKAGTKEWIWDEGC